MTIIDEKQLRNDWKSEFPLLQNIKGGRKLLRRSETMVWGIELRKYDSTSYRPEFIALNLLSSFHEFSIRRTISSERELQLWVPYKTHAEKYQKAAAFMREQFPILIEEKPSEDRILSFYRAEIEKDLKQFTSPLAVWWALIQNLGFYVQHDLQKEERQKMLDYANGLPPVSLALFGDYTQFVKNELDVSKGVLEERRSRNLTKGGWDKLSGGF